MAFTTLFESCAMRKVFLWNQKYLGKSACYAPPFEILNAISILKALRSLIKKCLIFWSSVHQINVNMKYVFPEYLIISCNSVHFGKIEPHTSARELSQDPDSTRESAGISLCELSFQVSRRLALCLDGTCTVQGWREHSNLLHFLTLVTCAFTLF